MVHFLIGLAILLAIIGGVLWTARTKPTDDGGSNVDSARRYGGGGL